jgi:hypothetical protein
MLEKAVGHGYDFQWLDDVSMIRVTAAINGNTGVLLRCDILTGADVGA